MICLNELPTHEALVQIRNALYFLISLGIVGLILKAYQLFGTPINRKIYK